MSDIVERLRDEVKESETRCRCMCHEAAAEIERLRARVAELEADDGRMFTDQARWIALAMRMEADRDRWKAEAMAWRNKERTTEESLDILLKHGPRSKQDKDSIRAMCDARDALKAARAANGGEA